MELKLRINVCFLYHQNTYCVHFEKWWWTLIAREKKINTFWYGKKHTGYELIKYYEDIIFLE